MGCDCWTNHQASLASLFLVSYKAAHVKTWVGNPTSRICYFIVYIVIAAYLESLNKFACQNQTHAQKLLAFYCNFIFVIPILQPP